jgi:hypothetical protein
MQIFNALPVIANPKGKVNGLAASMTGIISVICVHPRRNDFQVDAWRRYRKPGTARPGLPAGKDKSGY